MKRICLFFILLSCAVADNWSEVPSGVGQFHHLTTIKFFSPTTGFIGGSLGDILKTTDGGTTWVRKPSGFNNVTFFFIHFVDAQIGIISAGGGIICRTTNGGESWTQIVSPTSNHLFDGFFVNATTGYLCGQNATVLKTTNTGLTWTDLGQHDPGRDYLGCYYFSEAVGILPFSNLSIRKTMNGGLTYGNMFALSNFAKDITFINSQTGFVVGNGGFIDKTTDAGDSWTQVQATGQGYNLEAISFLNNQTGYAVGPRDGNLNGMIFKTVNQGTNWTLDTITQYTLIDVISNGSDIWVVGENGKIYHSGNPLSITQSSSEAPKKFSLAQNYPNPFNPTTHIAINIEKLADVRLVVYNMTGKEIQTLINEKLQPGIYKVNFDGSKLTSGIYFYTMTAGNFTDTKKMILVK